MRARSAACATPSVTAGRMMYRSDSHSPSLNDAYPATGSTRSLTAKMRIRFSPSQNVGMEIPTIAIAIAPASNHDPRFLAA